MVYLIFNPSNMVWIRENYSPYLNKHTIGIAIAIEINLFTCLINMKHQNLNKLLMSNPYFSQKNEKKKFIPNKRNFTWMFLSGGFDQLGY
jgi:hypothetical protein